MTLQEAYRLIEESIRFLQNSGRWGQIIVEVSQKGEIRHVNLLTSVAGKDGIIEAEKKL